MRPQAAANGFDFGKFGHNTQLFGCQLSVDRSGWSCAGAGEPDELLDAEGLAAPVRIDFLTERRKFSISARRRRFDQAASALLKVLRRWPKAARTKSRSAGISFAATSGSRKELDL